MITGDHAVTAQAIGEELGLGPGAISGAELAALSDAELKEALPRLHVFGRVTPEDKLRLARAMQEEGLIVAMTGDAVNDAAALKQADIGVAMGSGSEVTKQAARMVLTDDNFGTLVHAVEIGRRIYDKVVAYVRYQMTQLLSLVMLFLAATILNVNEGVAMTPTMVLFLLFFATASGVVIIAVDPGDPDVMHRPPRDPAVPITNRPAVIGWVVYAAVLFVAAFVPLVAGPDEPSPDSASASMTMTFAVMGLGTVFNALTNRRDPTSGLDRPGRQGAGDRVGARGDGLPRDAASVAAGRAPHRPAHRRAVAHLHRAGRAAAGHHRAGQGRSSAPPEDAVRPEPAGGRRPRSGTDRPSSLVTSDTQPDAVPSPSPDARRFLSPRRPWLWIILAGGLLVLGAVVRDLVLALGQVDLSEDLTATWAYALCALLVFADGVCALFPAETTLITASALAVEGLLDLRLVILAGAVGAVTGDSALYWLARLSRRRFQSQLDTAMRNDKVAEAMDLIGSSAPVLLVVGRYVPGLRFVVNASCGLASYPYPASCSGPRSGAPRGRWSPASPPTSSEPRWATTRSQRSCSRRWSAPSRWPSSSS